MSENALVHEWEEKLKKACIRLCKAKPGEREDCEQAVIEAENALRKVYLRLPTSS